MGLDDRTNDDGPRQEQLRHIDDDDDDDRCGDDDDDDDNDDNDSDDDDDDDDDDDGGGDDGECCMSTDPPCSGHRTTRSDMRLLPIIDVSLYSDELKSCLVTSRSAVRVICRETTTSAPMTSSFMSSD